MAYYSIFPEKDTTIYSHPDRTDMNTGKDELLELVEEKKSIGDVYFPSRILIKFKNTDIKDVIEKKFTGTAKEVNTDNCQINVNNDNQSMTFVVNGSDALTIDNASDFSFPN